MFCIVAPTSTHQYGTGHAISEPSGIDLVRLLVAAVVDRLADARDELGGALADPRAEVGLVLLLAADPRDLAARRRLGHHDEPLALAEPGRRRPLREPRDPLDHVALDATFLEAPNGTTPHDDIRELHPCLLHGPAAVDPCARCTLRPAGMAAPLESVETSHPMHEAAQIPGLDGRCLRSRASDTRFRPACGPNVRPPQCRRGLRASDTRFSPGLWSERASAAMPRGFRASAAQIRMAPPERGTRMPWRAGFVHLGHSSGTATDQRHGHGPTGPPWNITCYELGRTKAPSTVCRQMAPQALRSKPEGARSSAPVEIVTRHVPRRRKVCTGLGGRIGVQPRRRTWALAHGPRDGHGPRPHGRDPATDPRAPADAPEFASGAEIL